MTNGTKGTRRQNEASGPVIIIGASARAAAVSARAAGFEPWCIDLFADRDLRAIAPVRQCDAAAWASGVLPLLDGAPADGRVLFTGAMENHLDVVEAVLVDREALGSDAEAMRITRQPTTLAHLSGVDGLQLPGVIEPHTWRGRLQLSIARLRGRRMVVKPYRSASGARIEQDRAGVRVERDRYCQQYVEGKPISAAYHSDGWSVRLLGVTQQLLDGFRYIGSVGPLAIGEQQRHALTHVGVVLAQQCNLRGCFGVDAVVDAQGVTWPIEVNPRYTASMEVIERAHGMSVLSPSIKALRQPRGMTGKLIVFARQRCEAGELYDGFEAHAIADVPQVGTMIETGRPICTVFAEGLDVAACEQRLHEAAEKVYTHMQLL